jgi:cupin fold WbuC family metalloprotein
MKNFLVDNSGKSEALFFKKSFPQINKQIIKQLINNYKKNKKDVRICLHENKSSKIQCMINLISKKNFYIPHFHKDSEEYYFFIKNDLTVNCFNKKLKLIKKINVNKKNFLVKIEKNIPHITVPKNKFCIYLEFKLGPFDPKNSIVYKKKIKVR